MASILFCERELGRQSSYLYRFALLRLRDEELAREAVQDTFLAALENRTSFAGKSSLKTWLTAILKFKIVDLIRRQAKQPVLALADERMSGAEAEEPIRTLDADAGWSRSLEGWDHPEQAFENKRFWEVFEAGLQELPAKAREVFTMRDVFGYSTGEICKKIGVTETNCWVILHRARMAMREYLSKNWFDNST